MAKVRLTNGTKLLESLRDSDFDCYSAYGEVVDNAIQAEATYCRIRVKTKIREGRGKSYHQIEEIAFGDDGCGMDGEEDGTLHQCLSLGWSSRYNDREGIGRFGVGMTLGALHEVRRVEVYSKPKGGDWRCVYIDLDELSEAGENDAEIAKPIKKSPPQHYMDLVGRDSGTLVLWQKYDRQAESFLTMLPLMKTWFGRTFRKFIWKDFVIALDGDEIKAIDPLYVNTKKTEFPDDPSAELFEPITIEWPVPADAQRRGAPEMSVIRIKMSLLPEKFREYGGAGGSPEAKQRHIDDNEGVSILRNGREVLYDHIPHWPGGAPDEKDRWWGCEIEFDPVLDKDFTVKNIKRGAVPNSELKKAIHDKIKNTVKTCRDRVSDLFAKTKADKHQKLVEQGLQTGHEDAQSVAKHTPTPAGQLDKKKNFDQEVKKVLDGHYADKTAAEKARAEELFKDQPFTIIDRDWQGPAFMEVSHLGGADVIAYNLRHPFILRLNEIVSRIEKGEASEKDSKALRGFIDLLIIAYSKAETMFAPDTQQTAESFIEDLRSNWGQYLKRYMERWNKESGA